MVNFLKDGNTALKLTRSPLPLLLDTQALRCHPTRPALFLVSNVETGLYSVAQGGFKLVNTPASAS